MNFLKPTVIVLTLFVFVSFHARPQQIRWNSFDELTKNMRKQSKPIIIFIHTDWCKFCAMQENNTFNRPQVVKEINQNFYAVRLNAEETKDIIFLNKKYRYKPSGTGSGHHELAEMLGTKNGKLSFPSTVILSKSWQVIQRETGFLNSEELLMLLAQ